MDIPIDLNCSLSSKLAKEGVWVRGKVNNVDADIFVDTGAKYTIIDFDFWRKLCFDNKILDTHVCLVGAGGKNLEVVGEGNVWLEIGHQCLELQVVLVENFKFDFLLGNDFLKSQNAIIDYGRKLLMLGTAEIPFESLPSDGVAILRSVVVLPVGAPVRVKAELVGNHCGLALFGERQLVRADDRVLVAPVVTEADSNNSVLIELANTTRSAVSLQPGTKVMHLQPFISDVNAIHDDYAAENISEVPIEDLNIGHLSRKQQSDLLSVLKKHHVWPTSGQLETTHLVEHPIDVQGAYPVRQRPYRVPETKRQQIGKEMEKMLLSNVIQPSSSPWSSPVLLLEKPNGEF